MAEINNKAISKDIVKLIDSGVAHDSELGKTLSSKEAQVIYTKYESLKKENWIITREKLAVLAESLSLDKNASLGKVISALRNKSREPSFLSQAINPQVITTQTTPEIVSTEETTLPVGTKSQETVSSKKQESPRIIARSKVQEQVKFSDSSYSRSDIISEDPKTRLKAKLHFISDFDDNESSEARNNFHLIGKNGQKAIYGEAQLLSLIEDFNEAQLDAFIQRFTGSTPDWNNTGNFHGEFHKNFSQQANEVAFIGEVISPEGGRAGLNALIENNVEGYKIALVRAVQEKDVPAITTRLEEFAKKDPSLFEKTVDMLATIGIGVRNIPLLGGLIGLAGEKQKLQVKIVEDKDGKKRIELAGKHPLSYDMGSGDVNMTAKARFFEATLGVNFGAKGQKIINNTESFITEISDKISSNGIVDFKSLGNLSPSETRLIEIYNQNIEKIGSDGKNVLITALGNLHMLEMAKAEPDWHFKGVEAGISGLNILQGVSPLFFGIFFEKLGNETSGGEYINENVVIEAEANKKKATLESIGITFEKLPTGERKFATEALFPEETDSCSIELKKMGAKLENVDGKLVIILPPGVYLAFLKTENTTTDSVYAMYTFQQIDVNPNGDITKIGEPIKSEPYTVDQYKDMEGRTTINKTNEAYSKLQAGTLGGALYLARRHDFGGKLNDKWDKDHEALYKKYDRFFLCIGNEEYDQAIIELQKVNNTHAKNLLALVNRATTPDEKRSILVSALSHTYGGKNTRVLDKIQNVQIIVSDYTQKFAAEGKLIPANQDSRTFFTNALKNLKKGGTIPTKQLSEFPGFEKRIIGSAMCATPLGGNHNLDALPGSSEVFDQIWIDGQDGSMSLERKEKILDKNNTTIALGVSEMNKFLATDKVFAGKNLSITPIEYRTLLLTNELPQRLTDAGVEIDKPAIFFDAIAAIAGSKCLNDQGGVVHTTIKGAIIPPTAPVDDIAYIGTGGTIGTSSVSVLVIDPGVTAKIGSSVAGNGTGNTGSGTTAPAGGGATGGTGGGLAP